jgi:AraC family transcriptional regulator of adaptative response / DNA-3-methyladenine glycosylase II
MMAIMRERYRTPFDWNGLLTWLGARAIPGVEAIDHNTYIRGDVRVWHEGETAHTTSQAKRERRVFDLAADPAAIHAALASGTSSQKPRRWRARMITIPRRSEVNAALRQLRSRLHS